MPKRRGFAVVALVLLAGTTPAAAGLPVSSSALQLITVVARTSSSTTANLNAYRRATSSQPWQKILGPVTARVGRNGIAAAGAKREGDGKTPSGNYNFSFAFGVAGNPGVHFSWRQVTGHYLVWDDDSSSVHYNEWVDTRTTSAGHNPEPLYVTPVYNEAMVIAYNTARSPGMGSGIFLHISSGLATAGCVTLPASSLTPLMRWLQPGLHPVIQIRVG